MRDKSEALRAVLYARVSTGGESSEEATRAEAAAEVAPRRRAKSQQDPEVQLRALRPWVASRGWSVVAEEVDRISGDPKRRKGDPPGLARALRAISERRADVLVVFASDRLVRSAVGLLQLVGRVEALGGKVASLEDGADLDTTTDHGELFLFLRGWLARVELRLIRARSQAGVDRARAAGKHIGHPFVKVDLQAVSERRAQGQGWRTIARALGCESHMTIKRAWLRIQQGQQGVSQPPPDSALPVPSE